jgi:hypothetical protein
VAFGLGLMLGELKDAGMAIGHSGGGPGSVSAVYYFPERPVPCTISAFATAMPPVQQNLKWPGWPAACQIGSRRSMVNN